MSLPVHAKRSASLALLAALRNTLPVIIVVVNLWVITVLQGVIFTQYFVILATLSALLSLLMLRMPSEETLDPLPGPVTLFLHIFIRWLAVLALLLAIGYVTKFSAEFARRAVLPWAVTTPMLIYAVYLVLGALKRQIYLSKRHLRSAVIAGYNASGRSLVERLATHPEIGIRLEGFFDDRGIDRLGMSDAPKHLGGLADIADYVREHQIDVVFVTLPIREIKRMTDQIDALTNSTASIYYVPDIFVFDLIQSRTAMLMDIPIIALCETPLHGHRAVIKRAMDISIAAAATILLLPVLLVIAVLVKLSSPGPVIFRQRRYGLDGKEIHVYKFRSMTVTEDGDKVVQATKEDQRITPTGRILRRFSLDELPQLFNVLEGTMSLVGPRPHAVAHNEQYRQLIKAYMFRHKVMPGITGLAQVNGCRGETEKLEKMEARVNYDLDYLRHWTPLLDLKILLLTALRLWQRDSGAY